MEDDGGTRMRAGWSFVFRDVFVWIHVWEKEGMSGSSHHLLDHTVSYFLHGLIYTFAKTNKHWCTLRCTETAAPAASIFVYNLYMYCIYKVQSLLLHVFTSYHIHADKLSQPDTPAYNQLSPFGSVTQCWRPNIYPATVDQLLCDAFHEEKRFRQWPEKSVSRCYLVSRLSSHRRRDVTLLLSEMTPGAPTLTQSAEISLDKGRLQNVHAGRHLLNYTFKLF